MKIKDLGYYAYIVVMLRLTIYMHDVYVITNLSFGIFCMISYLICHYTLKRLKC